ncbi:hypothetical protein L7F22_046632 [Adiantum nelumboides]|nr:hypothetical protein [Adiantum nelumboides]
MALGAVEVGMEAVEEVVVVVVGAEEAFDNRLLPLIDWVWIGTVEGFMCRHKGPVRGQVEEAKYPRLGGANMLGKDGILVNGISCVLIDGILVDGILDFILSAKAGSCQAVVCKMKSPARGLSRHKTAGKDTMSDSELELQDQTPPTNQLVTRSTPSKVEKVYQAIPSNGELLAKYARGLVYKRCPSAASDPIGHRIARARFGGSVLESCKMQKGGLERKVNKFHTDYGLTGVIQIEASICDGALSSIPTMLASKLHPFQAVETPMYIQLVLSMEDGLSDQENEQKRLLGKGVGPAKQGAGEHHDENITELLELDKSNIELFEGFQHGKVVVKSGDRVEDLEAEPFMVENHGKETIGQDSNKLLTDNQEGSLETADKVEDAKDVETLLIIADTLRKKRKQQQEEGVHHLDRKKNTKELSDIGIQYISHYDWHEDLLGKPIFPIPKNEIFHINGVAFEVRLSCIQGDGYGLFVHSAIESGVTILHYGGPKYSFQEWKKICKLIPRAIKYSLVEDPKVEEEEDRTYILGFVEEGNVSCYINSSHCMDFHPNVRFALDPNLPPWYKCISSHIKSKEYGHICIETVCRVESGEELFADYEFT